MMVEVQVQHETFTIDPPQIRPVRHADSNCPCLTVLNVSTTVSQTAVGTRDAFLTVLVEAICTIHLCSIILFGLEQKLHIPSDK